MNDDLATALTEIAFTAEMPAVVRRQLVEGANIIQLNPGDYLFHEGASAREFYLVKDGTISLAMTDDHGDLMPLMELGAGEIIGWSPLVGNDRMTTQATATSKATVIVIPGDRVAQICEQDPQSGLHIMKCVAKALAVRLDRTRRQKLHSDTQ